VAPGREYTGAVTSEPEVATHDEAEETEERQPDPEREARRLVALAQIRQYPDPVLRMRARQVEAFDDELAQLVERMGALMENADGAGLAATQVGVLRRVFVMRAGENGGTRTLVNPELVWRSDEVEVDDEGCLSLQGLLVPVERSSSVKVEAKDVQGADIALELTGFEARACQHELDHLDGVLVIDRTTDEARRDAMGVLRQRSALGAR
jgi:peptide deformylase